MNQAMRWKRFIEWWEYTEFIFRKSSMSKDEVLDLIQERLDDLRKPEEPKCTS